MLRYITAGESHGRYLTAILEGLPSGVPADESFINARLEQRQQGYGRGGRQKIEKDHIILTGGVLRGVTTGAPVGFMIENRDASIDRMPDLWRPRPGHADLAGSLKYDQGIRAVLERASARETAMRVAAGALCERFLRELGIRVAAHVIQIGPVSANVDAASVEEIEKRAAGSPVFCLDPEAEKKMMQAVDEARRAKDTLGGRYEVRASGVPAGLGTYVHHERKLDGLLAQQLMSQQSVKAVEIGEGVRAGSLMGSAAHDEIFYEAGRGYYHKTNRAGGIEGGMSNGSDLVIRVTMKPIATLPRPLESVNMQTKAPEKADFERSDICAVPAGSVIGATLTAWVIAGALLEKFGGDSLGEIRQRFEAYTARLRS